MVTPPSNGYLALKRAPTKAVLNFTQAHIDQGQLLFVHNGKISLYITTGALKFEKTRKCVFHGFCKRVRKTTLILNLVKHSFGKSS